MAVSPLLKPRFKGGRLALLPATLGIIAATYVVLKPDAPSYPRPWASYAFSKPNRRLELYAAGGIFGPYEYESREDCMEAVRNAVTVSAKDDNDPIIAKLGLIGDGWQQPYGCYYYGYQNRYIQFLVNYLLNKDNFHCIERVTDHDIKALGYLYYPVVPALIDDDKGYCVVGPWK